MYGRVALRRRGQIHERLAPKMFEIVSGFSASFIFASRQASTPMAANFNLVPAALLDLKDKHGVIKRQVGTAVPLLVVNILLIYWLAFP